jgi:hypothetical protein
VGQHLIYAHHTYLQVDVSLRSLQSCGELKLNENVKIFSKYKAIELTAEEIITFTSNTTHHNIRNGNFFFNFIYFFNYNVKETSVLKQRC